MCTQYYKGSSIEVYSSDMSGNEFIAAINGIFEASLTYSNNALDCLAKSQAVVENQLLLSNLN